MLICLSLKVSLFLWGSFYHIPHKSAQPLTLWMLAIFHVGCSVEGSKEADRFTCIRPMCVQFDWDSTALLWQPSLLSPLPLYKGQLLDKYLSNSGFQNRASSSKGYRFNMWETGQDLFNNAWSRKPGHNLNQWPRDFKGHRSEYFWLSSLHHDFFFFNPFPTCLMLSSCCMLGVVVWPPLLLLLKEEFGFALLCCIIGLTAAMLAAPYLVQKDRACGYRLPIANEDRYCNVHNNKEWCCGSVALS